MATFWGYGNLDAKLLDKRLKKVLKWKWFEDTVSYTDHNGNEHIFWQYFKKCRCEIYSDHIREGEGGIGLLDLTQNFQLNSNYIS